MNFKALICKTISGLAALIFAAAPVGADNPGTVYLKAALVAEVETITPGQPLYVGLKLELDKNWHIYWRNPGDAGTPPKITWTLPDGFSAGDIDWPHPERIEQPPLTSFGYYGTVLLPVEITIPEDITAKEVTLSAVVDYLVCKEICLPGRAKLDLALPVSPGPSRIDKTQAEIFQSTRYKIPKTFPDLEVIPSLTSNSVILDIIGPNSVSQPGRILFLPYAKNIIEHAAPQEITKIDRGYRLRVSRSLQSLENPGRIDGLLVAENGWRGPESEPAMEFSSPVSLSTETVAATAASGVGSIWQAILFAFLGGLILNLMPCVLPVLSLKILGLVGRAGESRVRSVGHGSLFALGVLISFWILALALFLLRSGGEELGWGFQLQSPLFLVILSSFMFLFGLNLLGLFEIGGALTGFGATSRGGWTGSFLNGVTATIVATPCTAPFMGSALGFSLTQPAWAIGLIFTALGLGMAAPYLVLSAAPGLLRFIPKPGRWMETLKQAMGFVLLATVIWLCWVLGLQVGSSAVAVLLFTLLLLAVGGWVLGRWGSFGAPRRQKLVAYTISILLIGGGLGIGLTGVELTRADPPVAAVTTDGHITWEPFSPERLARLREMGKAVFIDFTAAWCLSCQVNERVAFGSSEVRRRFAELGIIAMKADWTARDAAITRALAGYGRNSVPLYVLHGPGSPADPLILPEILTPGIVLEALNKLSVNRP